MLLLLFGFCILFLSSSGFYLTNCLASSWSTTVTLLTRFSNLMPTNLEATGMVTASIFPFPFSNSWSAKNSLRNKLPSPKILFQQPSLIYPLCQLVILFARKSKQKSFAIVTRPGCLSQATLYGRLWWCIARPWIPCQWGALAFSFGQSRWLRRLRPRCRWVPESTSGRPGPKRGPPRPFGLRRAGGYQMWPLTQSICLHLHKKISHWLVKSN